MIELVRNKIIALAHLKRIIHFHWVKEQTGIEGNKLKDRLAKEAAIEDGLVVHKKIPREVIITREKENGLHMWQQQWTNTVSPRVGARTGTVRKQSIAGSHTRNCYRLSSGV